MIFGYSFAEARKTVMTTLVTALALAAYFITIDPAFQEAIVVVAGGVLSIVGVFYTENATAIDFSKAVQALAGSSVALVGFYTTVPDPSTVQNVVTLALALVNPIVVGYFGNAEIARLRH